MRQRLPERGREWSEIEEEMRDFASNDVDWRHGRHAFRVWYGGDDLFDIRKNSMPCSCRRTAGAPARPP